MVYLFMDDNWNWLRGPIEHLVEAGTGREFRIDGDLRVDLFPSPRVVMENVRFANPSWAKHRWMLTSKRVRFVLDGRALLRGDAAISELSLQGTWLALERNARGAKSWTLGEGADPDAIRPPRIGGLTIRDGTVRYYDASSDTSLTIWLHTNGTSDSLPTSFSAEGTYRGRSLFATGYAGEIVSITDTARPFPIRGVVQSGATRAVVEGTLTNLANFSPAHLQIILEGRDLADLRPLLPFPLPTTGQYSVKGALVRDGVRWQLRNFVGRVGNSDLSGTIKYEPSGPGAPKPKLTGTVHSGHLDLADLGGLLGENLRPGHDGRMVSSEPYEADRIRAINVDLRLTGQRLQRPGDLPLQDIAAHLVISDGIARLDPVGFGVADGTVVAEIQVDATRAPLRSRLHATAKQLRLARLLPEPRRKTGGNARVSGTIDLHGTGDSVAAFLASATGAIAFVGSGGTVSRVLADLGGLELGKAIDSLLGSAKPVAMRCGVASFDVESGIMSTDLLVLDTVDTVIVGSGSINLADETLSLTLRPETKTPGILSGRFPIRIEGTFSKPKLQADRSALVVRGGAALAFGLVNPLAALIPLVDTGTGEDANCPALIARVQQRERREGDSAIAANHARR